jgi:hypothetical protein
LYVFFRVNRQWGRGNFSITPKTPVPLCGTAATNSTATSGGLKTAPTKTNSKANSKTIQKLRAGAT